MGKRLLSQGNSWRRIREERPFEQPDQPMITELRIDFHQKMQMVGHDLKFKDVRPMLRRRFVDQFLEPNVGAVHQDFTSIFRAPDDVVFA